MITCPVCQTKFPFPEWPNTKQKYCSSKCTKKAWKLNHPKYKWNNPEKERQIKRRWNWSEAGKAYRKQWYELHKKEINKKAIDTKEKRQMIYSRNKAHEKLVKTVPPICINCSSNYNINCHHKDFNPFNNNLSNLEWLCKKCHTDKHHIHNLEKLTNL